MYFMTTVEQFKQTARMQFDQNYRAGIANNLWSKVRGRRHRLVRLDEMQRENQVKERNDTGIQTIAIEAILGSESRSTDFDCHWRPLRSVSRERWTGIAVARLCDVPLPAIDLIKAGDHYFVRDGHHRISVAKAQGQLEIEANITEWHLTKNDNVVGEPINPVHRQFLPGLSRQRLLQAFSIDTAKLSNAIHMLLDGIRLRTMSIFSRSRNPFSSGTAA